MKKQTTVKTMLAALAATFAFSAIAADAVTAKPAPAAEAKAPVTLESALAFLPDVLAEVGEEKITKAQLIKQLAQGQVAPEMLAQLPQEMVKGLLTQQIQEMVDLTVLLAMAKKAGIEPSAKLVKDETKQPIAGKLRKMFREIDKLY